MIKRLLVKLIQGSIVVIILSMVSFVLLNLMPGDPLDLMMSTSPDIETSDVERLRESLSLDKPIASRYLAWVRGLFLEGDLGFSRNYSKPVSAVVKPRIYNSLVLISFTILVSIFLSLFAVFLASHIRMHVFVDKLIDAVTSVGISSPTFWVGIILIFLFSVKLRILPAGGIGEGEQFSFIKDFKYIILPSFTMTFFLASYWTKYLRGAYLEILSQDYIKTARAKGLSETGIFLRHGFKNLLVPIIAIIAIYIPVIFGGALVTETVFSWPGVGRLLYESIIGNDFNVAMIILVIISCATVFANFGADTLYSLVDPRMREG